MNQVLKLVRVDKDGLQLPAADRRLVGNVTRRPGEPAYDQERRDGHYGGQQETGAIAVCGVLGRSARGDGGRNTGQQGDTNGGAELLGRVQQPRRQALLTSWHV